MDSSGLDELQKSVSLRTLLILLTITSLVGLIIFPSFAEEPKDLLRRTLQKSQITYLNKSRHLEVKHLLETENPIAAQSTANLNVLVQDRDGQPVEDARITLVKSDPDYSSGWRFVDAKKTNSSGEASFEVNPGTYSLTISSDGPNFLLVREDISVPNSITIDPSETVEVDLTAKRVDGSPLEGVVYIKSLHQAHSVGFLGDSGNSTFYVTPGIYSVFVWFGSWNGSPYYLYKKNVDLTHSSQLLFDATTLPVGKIELSIDSLSQFTDVSINPMLDWVNTVPVLDVKESRSAYLQAGSYSTNLRFIINANKRWYYWFDLGEITIFENDKINRNIGKPQPEVELSSESPKPGDNITLDAFFEDSYGNPLSSVMSGDTSIYPSLKVTNPSGKVIYEPTNKYEAWDKVHNFQLSSDAKSGTYDVTLKLDTGPWEGTIKSTEQFEVSTGEEPVNFPDDNLEQAIRDAIGKQSGKIYPSDLEGLEKLNAQGKGIEDLIGIEYCVDLQKLELGGNNITELSPLSKLTSLTELQVWENNISNLEPIKDLKNLEVLALNGNDIEDVSYLSNLTNLINLDLGGNSISDITHLSGLTQLEKLLLWENNLTDIETISNFTKLTQLALNGNEISKINHLSGLTNLKDLDLGGNKISDLSPLSDLTNLNRLILWGNEISDISPLLDNSGLGSGDEINLKSNYLDLSEGSEDMQNIQTLIDRGAEVEYDPQNKPSLVAFMERWFPEDEEWRHWDDPLETDESQLKCKFRGTESQKRSDGEIVKYEWDFGDGRTSFGETTARIYTSGTHNITLTVTDEYGNTSSETKQIEVKGQGVPDWRKDLQEGDIVLYRDSETLGAIKDFYYTHAGLYAGEGKVYEAYKGEGIRLDRPITDWDDQEAKAAFRVTGITDEQIDGALQFVLQQALSENGYQQAYIPKCAEPTECSMGFKWYCSELVWAAFYSQGIQLEKYPARIIAIPPDQLAEHPDTYKLGVSRWEAPSSEYENSKTPHVIEGQSPINVSTTLPNGDIVSRDNIDVPGAIYIRYDYDEDGETESAIAIPDSQVGEGKYSIQVEPTPEAKPEDTYSLLSTVKGAKRTVEEDEQIQDIPTEGYSVDSDKNTLQGTNISLTLADSVDITYEQVEEAGNTKYAEMNVPPIELPSNINFLNQYYRFSTTAAIAGGIDITISYGDTDLNSSQEQNLKLYKISDDGKVENITSSNDPQANTVTGRTDSLSYFSLGFWSLTPNWNIISPPGVPVDPDPATSLGDDLEPLYLYYDYSPGDGYTTYPDDSTDTQLSWEKGYWTMVSEETSVDIDVNAPSGETTIELNSPGWHLVGVPSNYDWANIGVRQGDSQTMTIGEQADGPSAPHWISRFLWEYDSETESTYTAYDASTSSYTMKKWKGYWVRTREDNVTLVIPYDSSNSTTSKDTQAEGIPMNSEKAKKLNIPAPPSPPNQDAESNELLPVQAAPNPVTGDQLTFSIPETEPNVKKVKLEVFSTSGEQMYQSSYLDSRTITWDLTTSDGNKLANGIYLYQIQAKGVAGETRTSAVKKLLVLQ